MDLQRWMNIRANYDDYLKWKDDPVTKAVMSGMKESASVNKLVAPTGDSALQQLGFYAGRDTTLNTIMSLDEVFVPGDGDVGTLERSQLLYMMNVEGYSEPDAKRIIKQQQGE